MDMLLILRRIRVENANTIAGLTWGFPAITHFLGFSHALQRKAADDPSLSELQMTGCGVICHQHQTFAYRPGKFADQHFALTRNPLNANGSSPSFVEEGRMHMEVSLVIAIKGRIRGAKEQLQAAADKLQQLASGQRLAGGTIVEIGKAALWRLERGEEQQRRQTKRLMRSLLPGFALVSRQHTLAEYQQSLAEQQVENPQFQALLDFASLRSRAEVKGDEMGNTSQEKHQWSLLAKPEAGWLKPIAVGYKAISPLYQAGEVGHVRDRETPVCFVETLYSLGEWLGPHRLTAIDDLLWHYQYQNKQKYLAINHYETNHLTTETKATSL